VQWRNEHGSALGFWLSERTLPVMPAGTRFNRDLPHTLLDSEPFELAIDRIIGALGRHIRSRHAGVVVAIELRNRPDCRDAAVAFLHVVTIRALLGRAA
jgi:hypothetical protein